MTAARTILHNFESVYGKGGAEAGIISEGVAQVIDHMGNPRLQALGCMVGDLFLLSVLVELHTSLPAGVTPYNTPRHVPAGGGAIKGTRRLARHI